MAKRLAISLRIATCKEWKLRRNLNNKYQNNSVCNYSDMAGQQSHHYCPSKFIFSTSTKSLRSEIEKWLTTKNFYLSFVGFSQVNLKIQQFSAPYKLNLVTKNWLLFRSLHSTREVNLFYFFNTFRVLLACCEMVLSVKTKHNQARLSLILPNRALIDLGPYFVSRKTKRCSKE